MSSHRKDYRNWEKNTNSINNFFLLFEECGVENCFVELLEAKECISKDELRQLEGKYIRELVCVNKRIEGRTRKEYREDNKKRIKTKKGTICSCNCGSTYTFDHKARHERTIKHQTFINKLSKQLNNCSNKFNI